MSKPETFYDQWVAHGKPIIYLDDGHRVKQRIIGTNINDNMMFVTSNHEDTGIDASWPMSFDAHGTPTSPNTYGKLVYDRPPPTKPSPGEIWGPFEIIGVYNSGKSAIRYPDVVTYRSLSTGDEYYREVDGFITMNKYTREKR